MGRARAWVSAALAALLSACSPSPPPTLPTPSVGAELLGLTFQDDWIERWVGPARPLGGPGAPRATLVRFWTDTCAYCRASLPTLEQLRAEYGGRGLRVLAIHHPKPRRAASDAAGKSDAELRSLAAERGYHGALASDPHWHALERAWWGTGTRQATSASLLLDGQGRVRYVHPGPLLASEALLGRASAPAELAQLRLALDALLGSEDR